MDLRGRVPWKAFLHFVADRVAEVQQTAALLPEAEEWLTNAVAGLSEVAEPGRAHEWLLLRKLNTSREQDAEQIALDIVGRQLLAPILQERALEPLAGPPIDHQLRTDRTAECL